MRFYSPNRLTPQQTTFILVVITVFVLYAMPSYAGVLPHRGDKHEAHKEVEAVEDQWREAMLNNNVADMDKLLADDYIAITANGTIETKAQALALRKAGTLRVTKLEPGTTSKIRIYGDTAVANFAGRESMAPTAPATSAVTTAIPACTTTGRGTWRILSFEASRMRDPHAAQKP